MERSIGNPVGRWVVAAPEPRATCGGVRGDVVETSA